MADSLEDASAMGAGSRDATRRNAPASSAPAQRPAFFNFDAQAVRVLGAAEEPWFVANDVCAALGLTNPRQAVSALESDEKGVSITDTLGGPQEMLTVNESGLYALIFRSRKPQARLFRRWVTSVVLPSIRRTGHYAPAHTPAGTVSLPAHPPALMGVPVNLPPVPTAVDDVARVLMHLLRGTLSTRMVEPGALAQAFLDLDVWPHVIMGPVDYQMVSHVCRIVQRYWGRWLPVESEPHTFVAVQPMGAGRGRRYRIQRWTQEVKS